MRQKRTPQMSLHEVFAEHDIGRELKAMSQWLDEHREVLEWVAQDLRRGDVKDTGREGLSVESVLRCGLLKQYRQLTYEELAFHVDDSQSFRAFSRLSMQAYPKRSVLQQTISRISDGTWEHINRVLLGSAKTERVERGQMMRIDSTVTASPIHEPSDSSLLCDAVRVMVRVMKAGEELAGESALTWRNHHRVARKRARSIVYARGAHKKRPLYKDLVAVTRASMGYVKQAALQLSTGMPWTLALEMWQAQVRHYLPLIEQVIAQTERRVFEGETVPASEKMVSLFEEHTDIIVKGSRDVQYGHKLNLTMGKSGLIIDAMIESGNPADSERFMPMLRRHIDLYGCAPRQVAADGCYASEDNLKQAKDKGVEDMAFQKKRGLTIEAMVKSHWVYRKLRNFRAGIEAGISCLKRAYGLGRCTWKGLARFKAYVWSSVVAYNLALFVRLKPT